MVSAIVIFVSYVLCCSYELVCVLKYHHTHNRRRIWRERVCVWGGEREHIYITTSFLLRHFRRSRPSWLQHNVCTQTAPVTQHSEYTWPFQFDPYDQMCLQLIQMCAYNQTCKVLSSSQIVQIIPPSRMKSVTDVNVLLSDKTSIVRLHKLLFLMQHLMHLDFNFQNTT